MFILKGLKVLCFDTLSQVFILKVDSGLASGLAGALVKFFAHRILLKMTFRGNVERKGVSGAGGYFMGYYTIWLAPVKGVFLFRLGIREEGRSTRPLKIPRGRLPAGEISFCRRE